MILINELQVMRMSKTAVRRGNINRKQTRVLICAFQQFGKS